jgi:hypothetical protein
VSKLCVGTRRIARRQVTGQKSGDDNGDMVKLSTSEKTDEGIHWKMVRATHYRISVSSNRRTSNRWSYCPLYLSSSVSDVITKTVIHGFARRRLGGRRGVG